MGFEATVGPCEIVSSTASGIRFVCPYDFHALRSEEIGSGPFGGSLISLTVEDGKIVRQTDVLNYAEEFSPEMWEPFADWVSSMSPDDAAVTYTDATLSDGRLTQRSIRLWELRNIEYVEAVLAGETT